MKNDGANTTIRQNLALIVGLQGRFEEAEQIVSRDLPPDLVAANIAYLRTMLSQNNVWDALKGGKKPSGKTKG
jgi:Flp pilus assembly protein TadD